MCRMITFGGTCPRCTGIFSWADLTQQLSCLEAKNSGAFGRCHRGVQMEEHTYNQECDACAADIEADEGYFGGDGLENLDYDIGGYGYDAYGGAGASSSSGGGGGGGGGHFRPISSASMSGSGSGSGGGGGGSAKHAKSKSSGKGKAKKSTSPEVQDGRRQKRQRTS